MRNFTLFTAMAALAATSAAAAPLAMHQTATASEALSLKAAKQCGINSVTLKSDSMELPDAEIIWEVEGEQTLWGRDCDQFMVEGFEAVHSYTYGTMLRTAVTDEGDHYAQLAVSGLYLPTWAPVQLSDSTMTFAGAYPVYEDYDWDIDDYVTWYLMPMRLVIDEIGGTYLPDFDNPYTLTRNAEGKYVSNDPNMLLGIAALQPVVDDSWEPTGEYQLLWSGYGDRSMTIYEVTSPLVTLPEGLEAEKWAYKDQYAYGWASVAVDGNDIYVQGLDRDLPDAWAKGEIRDGKAVFPSGQYLGPDQVICYLSYLWGAKFRYEDGEIAGITPQDEFVFTYDAEAKRMEMEVGYVISGSDTEFYALYSYDQGEIVKQNRDINTPPAMVSNLTYSPDPYGWGGNNIDFTMLPIDADGNLLESDRLYYRILADGEVVEFETWDGIIENIPYIDQNDLPNIYSSGTWRTVTIWSNPEQWVGVQALYINEDGEMLEGEIAKVNLNQSALDEVAAAEVVGEERFDLQGRRVAADAKGITIVKRTLSDGTVTTTKEVR